VLREYARIAFADIRKFTEKNGDSGARQFKQLDDLSDDEAAAIVEFSTDGEGRTAKIKLHDKKKALEALARHLGLFAARREQSRNPSASARELRELLERRFARILKPEGSADGNRQHASVLRALRRGLVASDRFTNSSILRLDQCLLEHLGLTQCTWISMRPFAKLIILW